MPGNTKTLPSLPARPMDGHKGTFGRVVIVGGSLGMIGAPAFAGLAALRTGAGLVYAACPGEVLHAVLAVAPELVGIPLGSRPMTRAGSSKSSFAAALESADAVVIGPGMGTGDPAKLWLKRVLKLNKPVVVDADALNLLAGGMRWPADVRASCVLTPHPGEMARMLHLLGPVTPQTVPTDSAGRLSLAMKASHATGQVVVLKGHRTVVALARRWRVNTTGDSSLAKAGTGDVLSGIIGSLLGQGMGPFESACLGVHLHGLAGEIAGKRLGPRSVLARDVIAAIPEAIGILTTPHKA